MNNMFLAQFQSSKWSADPIFLESFIRRLAGLKVTESIAAIEVAARPRSYNVINGRAVINISGVLLKTVPAWLRFWGIEATGYDEIQAQLGQALADTSIDGIHLQVSSPGGIVDGLIDTADAIFNARRNKKVTATIEDLGASAAYWLASQAATIGAGRTTEVGSIGVYTVYYDYSKEAEDLGIKVVLIRSGEHKGMGVPGAEITAGQIAAVQANIDAIADQFVDSVARGRAMEAGEVRKLATGRLWIAEDAKKLGLIDIVTNASQQSSSNNIQSLGDKQMETVNTTAQPDIEKVKNESSAAAVTAETERMKALSGAFPDDPEFAIRAFTSGKTIEQAKADYCDVLREKIRSRDNQKPPVVNQKPAGAPPIASGDTDGAGAGDFMAEARAMAEEKHITVTEAMKKLNRSNPRLHEQFVQRCEADGMAMYGRAG